MVDYRKRYASPNSKGYHQGKDERKFKSEYVGKAESITNRRLTTIYPTSWGFHLPISLRSSPNLSKKDLEKGKRRKEGRLELLSDGLSDKLKIIVSFGSVIAGGFFLSNKLTGFAVGNLSSLDANVTGVIMFVFGIFGLLLFLRK